MTYSGSSCLRTLLHVILASTASTLVLGCKNLSEGELQETVSVGDEFVRVDPIQRDRLIYQGREYRFSAANSYSMLYSKEAADKQFATMRNVGNNALRMWGFWNGPDPKALQSSPGQFAEEQWRLFDYVIARAGQEGIKLILPLANYWDEFGGIVQLNEWAGLPPEKKEYFDREIFYTNEKTREIYRNYVLSVLHRRNTVNGLLYKNDPAILMWEPMNEARGRSDPSGKTVADWLAWASALIKENDPNHLVGSGTEGFFMSHPTLKYYPWQAANPAPAYDHDGKLVQLLPEGSYFELDCKIPTIDLCSIHAWPYQWFIEPRDAPDQFISDWIEEHLSFMNTDPAYKKPLYLAEFGYQITRSDGAKAMAVRNSVFKRAYLRYDGGGEGSLRAGLAGIGFWNISENENPPTNYLSFDVTCPGDLETCKLIREFSKKQVP